MTLRCVKALVTGVIRRSTRCIIPAFAGQSGWLWKSREATASAASRAMAGVTWE